MDSVHRELLFYEKIKFAAFFPCKNFPKMISCACKEIKALQKDSYSKFHRMPNNLLSEVVDRKVREESCTKDTYSKLCEISCQAFH